MLLLEWLIVVAEFDLRMSTFVLYIALDQPVQTVALVQHWMHRFGLVRVLWSQRTPPFVRHLWSGQARVLWSRECLPLMWDIWSRRCITRCGKRRIGSSAGWSKIYKPRQRQHRHKHNTSHVELMGEAAHMWIFPHLTTHLLGFGYVGINKHIPLSIKN